MRIQGEARGKTALHKALAAEPRRGSPGAAYGVGVVFRLYTAEKQARRAAFPRDFWEKD